MDVRFRIALIVGMGLLVVAAWTFPAWYPIINREGIVERLPGLELDAQPDFALLPREVQDAYLTLYFGDEDEEQPPRPDLALALVRARLRGQDIQAPEAEEVFAPPSNTIASQGEFTQIDPIRGAQGQATIYQLSDLSYVLRIDAAEDAEGGSVPFSSTRAPDVHLILTRNPDPTDERSVGIDYIDLGPLKANTGPQTYTGVIPRSVDFNEYSILALYSVQYDYVISTAALG